MPNNALPFESFRDACEKAVFYYPRPYGIYHKGECFWDAKLPRKKGSVVRYFEDHSGPCLSLVVLSLDGEFLCCAFPVSWAENDHPAQHEAAAYWASLSPEEKAKLLEP